jgi:hypothetical protein
MSSPSRRVWTINKGIKNLGHARGRRMSEYKKCCYWVDTHGLRNVRRNLEEKEIELREEARIPCRVLRESMNTAFVAPTVWDGFCRRRTSWYRKSDKTGKFLVVSNLSLDHLDIGGPIIIKESNFKPDHLPSYQEILQLIESEEYQNLKPDVWEKVDPLDKEFYQRWFERYQPRELFDFDKIFAHHSANHANFIDPKFLVNMDGIKSPYSIADSIHVCSSCLEFVNILGKQWPIKYVLPCIGAVQFAHLPIDQYFEVRIQKGE